MSAQHSQSTNLADLLERILDKGVVIAGDISIGKGGTMLRNALAGSSRRAGAPSSAE